LHQKLIFLCHAIVSLSVYAATPSGISLCAEELQFDTVHAARGMQTGL